MKRIITTGAYFVLGLVFAAGCVYCTDTLNAQSTDDVLSRTVAGGGSDRATQLLLAELSAVTIDTTFFKKDIFVSLEDFSVPVFNEPFRRVNPFAPLGVE